MTRAIVLSVCLLASGLLLSGSALAEDREDCFEACDTKMETCLNKCSVDKNGDPVRSCRNECAVDDFHPCLDHCPHPRTGITPAEKRLMDQLEELRKHKPKQTPAPAPAPVPTQK